MKAEFKLKIIRHKNFTNSFHNSPLIDSISHPEQPDWYIDTFKRTVPMSTYLIGFIVSDFESVKMKSLKYGIDIEILARPEVIRNLSSEYVLNETTKIIDYFADYFNVSYPLEKSGKNIGYVCLKKTFFISCKKIIFIFKFKCLFQIFSRELWKTGEL